MVYQSYINLTPDLVGGLSHFLKQRGIQLDEVVEVFAGNGKLGLSLGLKEHCNISDSLLFAREGYEDDINKNWHREPPGVLEEFAYETVIRFSAEKDRGISLLILGAPPPANSYYCPSYEAIKALHYCFDAEILYIGEMDSHAFASPKFFRHLKEVEGNLDNSFKHFVKNNYDNQNGYFSSELFFEQVDVQPYLLKFAQCNDAKCDCRDDSKVKNDVLEYEFSMTPK